MRIESPRTPKRVEHEGREVYCVGFSQMLMLRLIDAVGRGEAPPEGLLTATGILRKHVASDLIHADAVAVEVKKAGIVNYYLTKVGREILRDGITFGGPRTKEQRKEAKELERAISLLARQRNRAAAKAKKGNGGAQRRVA